MNKTTDEALAEALVGAKQTINLLAQQVKANNKLLVVIAKNFKGDQFRECATTDLQTYISKLVTLDHLLQLLMPVLKDMGDAGVGKHTVGAMNGTLKMVLSLLSEYAAVSLVMVDEMKGSDNAALWGLLDSQPDLKVRDLFADVTAIAERIYKEFTDNDPDTTAAAPATSGDGSAPKPA
jgi:hypothetical protein